MSGDVELNPGPLTCNKANSVVRAPTLSILELRLHQFGLKPLDVGGDGDCFFRAVSHQLYGNPNSHGIIRAAGIQFLTENPERFIESNSEHSWIQYLTSMSCQGTWADGIIIQAIGDAFNLKIHIIESHPDFAEITLVEGVTAPSLSHEQLAIFIGHLDEFHYVSTEPLMGCQRISQLQNKQSILRPGEKRPSFPKISSQDSHKHGSSHNSQKHFMNICLTQPGKFSCAVDSFLELTFAIFKDSLKHAFIDNNDFFQIVIKACLQLENNDVQADITAVREPVWAYLRQHCYSFASSSDDAVFSDIFTLNTVGVMTQELKSLFLVQLIKQSICSSCTKAISNNTSLFTIYITSLNLSQTKFEDSVSAAILRKSSRLKCDVCQKDSGEVSMLQHFIILPKFLSIELCDNMIDQVFFPLTMDVFGQNYVLKGIVRCLNHHFTVAIKDDSLWVYIDDMCSSVRNYTSCHDLLHTHPGGWFFAIFEKCSISIKNDIEAASRASKTSQQDSVCTLLNISDNNKTCTATKSSALAFYAICFSLLKPCSYWNSDTLDAIVEYRSIFF